MTTDIALKLRRIADRFNEVSMGEKITFEQLSATIGEDIKTQRYLIYKAMKMVENEIGAKFKALHKEGYQRLHSSELNKIGQTSRRRIRHTAKRAVEGISAGLKVANDLSPVQLNSILREQSALGVIEHLARDKNLPDVPMDETRALTASQVTRNFLDKIGGPKKEA